MTAQQQADAMLREHQAAPGWRWSEFGQRIGHSGLTLPRPTDSHVESIMHKTGQARMQAYRTAQGQLIRSAATVNRKGK